MFKNFVCNKAYFILYPILDWKPVTFFQGGDMETLRGVSDNPAE